MPLPDPLHLAVALGPIATYLLVLGLIHLSARPLVVSGGRDAAALAVAIAGLVIAGPLELFLVEEAAVRYGLIAWVLMLTAYALIASLIILMQRPRIVIYNITLQQLRPVLGDAVLRLDENARWAGESLDMPHLGVRLYLECTPLTKNVQLVAAGPEQNLPGWKHLEKTLASALRKTRSSTRRLGLLATAAGLGLAFFVTYLLARDPGNVMHAVNEMLRR
jgi:hypothetical protein